MLKEKCIVISFEFVCQFHLYFFSKIPTSFNSLSSRFLQQCLLVRQYVIRIMGLPFMFVACWVSQLYIVIYLTCYEYGPWDKINVKFDNGYTYTNSFSVRIAVVLIVFFFSLQCSQHQMLNTWNSYKLLRFCYFDAIFVNSCLL